MKKSRNVILFVSVVFFLMAGPAAFGREVAVEDLAVPADTPEAEAERLNAVFEEVARALAVSMKSGEIRTLVREQAGQRFDGDTEFLYRDLANRTLSTGTTFHQRLVRIAGRDVGRKSFRSELSQAIADLPQLQVAVPVGFEAWDPRRHTPLVAFWPAGVNDEDVLVLDAYDADGDVHELDAWRTPESPVVVVGLNERTDGDGFLVAKGAFEEPCEEITAGGLRFKCGGGGGGGGGGGSTCDTTASHAYGDPEIFHTLTIFDDHEPALKGAPEIFIEWTNPVTGAPATRQFTNVDAEHTLYTLDSTLFTWTSPSSSGFLLKVWEQDGFLPGDNDDLLGSAFVAFTDDNCRLYPAGDAEFKMKFK